MMSEMSFGECIVEKNITDVQREFLKILKSFMYDEEYHLPEGFTGLPELIELSRIHNVNAVVYEQIRQDVLWQEKKMQSLQEQVKRASIYMVMFQVQRTDSFLEVYRRLCEGGIRPLVVKGLICRNLYSKPDYRISGDEDMLIRREDFEACDRILRENGFQREELEEGTIPYEVAYLHPKARTYIEVHCSLFPENSGAYSFLNDEFSHVFERCICEEIQGTSVWTLSPTEHMFYLICHSFKHFLHSGFGIRQVCDMVMMAEHYAGQINWEKIGRKLKRLNMAAFWAGLAEIGRCYLGFDWEKAQYSVKLQKADVGAEELLMDLLHSGVYGDSSLERRHSSNVTLAAAKTGKKSTVAALKESIFPPMSYMKRKYDWVQAHSWLLPVAWGVRMFSYFMHSDRDKSEGLSGLEIGMERVELLRKYKIIR